MKIRSISSSQDLGFRVQSDLVEMNLLNNKKHLPECLGPNIQASNIVITDAKAASIALKETDANTLILSIAF